MNRSSNKADWRRAVETPALNVFTFADFMARGHRDRRWLLDGILPRTGVALLAGDPFVGKTRFALGLVAAASAATNTFLGRTLADVEGRPALYLALEHSDQDWQEALRQAAGGAGLDALNVTFVRPPFDLDDPLLVGHLLDLVRKLNPWIVVVDSLRRVTSADENSSTEMRPVFARLAEVAADQRLILVLHHLSHAKTLRGTTDLKAASDAVVKLTRRGSRTSAGRLVLEVESHSTAVATINVRISHDNGWMRFDADGETPASDEALRDRIITAFKDGGRRGARKLSLTELEARNLGVKAGVIRAQVKELVAEGVVAESGGKNAPDHHYVLVTED